MSWNGLEILNIKNEVRGTMVEIKSLIAGALFLYALLLILSAFNLANLIYIPIKVYDIEIGKIASALIIGTIAYFLVKKR